MLRLSIRDQFVIGSLFVLLVIATRGHHFTGLHHLPGASWAAFFLAGVYLRPVHALAGLLALTWVLDFAAITRGGVSAFCVTPAYLFLLPAYGALWLAGRWYRARHRFAWNTLLPLVTSALVGAAVCELLSSGGFYFFSGRFVDPTFSEFATRLIEYFPPYLKSLGFYIAMAACVHFLLGLTRGIYANRRVTSGNRA